MICFGIYHRAICHGVYHGMISHGIYHCAIRRIQVHTYQYITYLLPPTDKVTHVWRSGYRLRIAPWVGIGSREVFAVCLFLGAITAATLGCERANAIGSLELRNRKHADSGCYNSICLPFVSHQQQASRYDRARSTDLTLTHHRLFSNITKSPIWTLPPLFRDTI